MTTAAYDAAAAAHSKQVQWLVEIDLDRCAEDYTTAPCTASDAGDGSRCWYSFPTCQDPANYNKTTRTYRFCLNDVPWPDVDTAVYPLLSSFLPVPQKINPKKLQTYPETLAVKFLRDYLPPPVDADKTLHNTTRVGEFWRNLFSRNRNYSGKPMRIYRGFNASGFVLSDFDKIGPTYLITKVEFDDKYVRVSAESPLKELDKRKLPFSVSDDNVLQSGVTDVATSWTVKDGTEFPDPADYTRNTIYAECESEIVEISSISGNVLTVVRGAFGTSNVAHAISTKVKHVACFGTAAGAATNAMEVMQDLLEFAGIAAADVNTSEFDNLKSQFFPDDDTLRTVRREKSIARLVQQMRDIRSVVLFINSAGKWTPAVIGPNLTSSTIDDDYFLMDSVEVVEDDEERITRCTVWYDPVEDNASDFEDFQKIVQVRNAGLEGANFFNDVRPRILPDLWLDPDFTVAKIRNLARRIITRTAYGLRMILFRLEVKDGTLNVGEMRTGQTRELTGIAGEQVAMPLFVTAKKEVDRAVNEYEAVDTNFSGRFARFGPDTMTDDYDSATEEDKQYAYFGDTDNRVGTIKEEGYIKF